MPSGAQSAWPEHELQPAHSPLAGAAKEVGLVVGSAGGTAVSRCCSRIAFPAAYGLASFSAGTSTRWAPRRPLAALLVAHSPPCLAMREARVWRSQRSRLALRTMWRVRGQCAGSAPAVRQLQRLRSTQTPDCALGEESRGSGGPAPVSLPPLVINGPRLSRDTPWINDLQSVRSRHVDLLSVRVRVYSS